MSDDKSLKEVQIKVAQEWVNIMAVFNPHYKDKKVVDVEETENPFEILVCFNDWSKTRITGLDAKLILTGKMPVTN